jgi:glycosyltransferase involved in cell wall biosynthesis
VLPLAGLEALASGLPVVTTRVGGLPELVRSGQTGRLLDIDDAAALGDALEELVTDTALRQRMSTEARADAVERFDSRKNALRVFEFIRSRT